MYTPFIVTLETNTPHPLPAFENSSIPNALKYVLKQQGICVLYPFLTMIKGRHKFGLDHQKWDSKVSLSGFVHNIHRNRNKKLGTKTYYLSGTCT